MALDTAFFSTSGNDTTGTGSQLNPYATPKKAVDNLNPNGTAYGRGGTYTGIRGTNDSNDTFRLMPSGTGTNYTTVKNFDNEPVEFVALHNTGVVVLTPANFTRLRFEGITFTASVGAGTSQACFTGHGGASAGSFLDVINCTLRNFQGMGIQTASSTDGRMLGCTVTGLRYSTFGVNAYPIYVNTGSHRWEVGFCTFDDNDSAGIHHYGSGGEANDCRYHDNLISRWGLSEAATGILVANGTGHWIWNNIVRDGHPNAGHAFEAEYAQSAGTDTRNSIWAHNIGYNAPNGYGFSFTQSGAGNLLINNIAVGNGLGSILNSEGAALTTNLFSGVPPSSLWVDPVTAKNFHLLPGATAARGQGTLNANFLTDREGRTRTAPPDIGPYEFVDAAMNVQLAIQRRTRIVAPQLAGFR